MGSPSSPSIMAARRVAATSIDWAEFAKKIPQAQKGAFSALKTKNEGFTRAIAALPAELPKLDFATYKERINVPGMVDEFQKKYEGLSIPYPQDTLAAKIDRQAQEEKDRYEKFVSESKTRISGINTELAKWQAMMPVEDMNLEEALEAVPHMVIDVKNNPTFWPHDRDYDEWVKFMKDQPDSHH